MKKNEQFSFEISLSILEQLGRGLYRNFITIIGEAISNSWDADATNVWIETKEKSFAIKDDGIGMTTEEFQGKFLRIGYSKRKKGVSAKSNKGRPFIGRKGIGKLALLSCAEEISILTKSKSKGHDYVGGTINNSALDDAIENEGRNEERNERSYVQPKEYQLGKVDKNLFAEHKKGHKHGTIIRFDNLKNKKIPTESFLRKAIALHFRFSLMDKDFHIHLNNKEVTIDDLGELIEKTQFLWEINRQKNDKFFKKIKAKAKEFKNITIADLPVRGFVASVIKPRDLNIFGADLKIGVDFYVNGRFRETNLLKGTISTQYIASYLYGQIHYDEIDSKDEDPFTTSREGVRPENEDYEQLTTKLGKSLKDIGNQWDEWRRNLNQDGDPDDPRIPKHQRKIEESKNARVEDFGKKIDSIKFADQNIKRKLKDKLRELSSLNTDIYQDLFILENLLRVYLKNKGLNSFDDMYTENKEYKLLIEDCLSRAKFFKENAQDVEKVHKLKGIIRKIEHDTNYFNMVCLGTLIDSSMNKKLRVHGMMEHVKEVNPVRNAVMHTNEVTQDVKNWPEIIKIIDILDNLIEEEEK